MIAIQERQLLQHVRQLRKTVAALEAEIRNTINVVNLRGEQQEVLASRLDHRIDNLERLCFKLRDEKLSREQVIDLVLEHTRRVRR